MITMLLNYLSDLRAETELLEALNWDSDLLQEFHDELTAMLMAAPPSIDKALFWLKNTPWDCFNNNAIPANVWPIVEKMIKNAERKVHAEIEQKQSRTSALPYFKSTPGGDPEWN